MKYDSVSNFYPSICHKVIGPDAIIFIFWMLCLKPAFSLSSFTLIKRLFSSSLLSAIRVVSYAYLRLLMFLLAILIPACASSSLAFCMMYCEYRASLVAQLVKNLPALQETWVQSLGWENPLGKARLPTPVFLPGEFHGLSRPWGSQRVWHKWGTFTHFTLHIS